MLNTTATGANKRPAIPPQGQLYGPGPDAQIVLWNNSRILCMAPRVLQNERDVQFYMRKLMETGPQFTRERRSLYALVDHSLLATLKETGPSKRPEGLEFRLEAQMPLLPGQTFCVWSHEHRLPDNYDAKARAGRRKAAEILSSTPAVSLGDALVRLAATGYGLDMPDLQPASVSNRRFQNPIDTTDLVRLWAESFGDSERESHAKIAELKDNDFLYSFAIRNQEGRIVSFHAVQYMQMISNGPNPSIPALLFSSACTAKSEQGRGLMTALLQASHAFVTTMLVSGPAILYTEARANGDAALKIAIRSGFEFGGCMPDLDVFENKPVSVNLMYRPHLGPR